MTAATGRIYDRGYRPYDGPRGGRRAAMRAVWVATMRRALGLGRSARHKIMPWALLTIATIPAAVFVGVAYLTRESGAAIRIISYRDYVGVSTTLLLFVAIAAPDSLCPDRRQRVLPLILSRPLSGLDYALARLAGIFTVVFAFAFIPQVVLFVGRVLVSDRALDYIRENAEVLWQSPLAVTVLALFMSTLGMACSAVTSRRIIGAANFLGLLLVSSIVAGTLESTAPMERAWAGAINLITLPIYVRDLIFLGGLDQFSPLGRVDNGGVIAIVGYVLVVASSLAVLAFRYRWAER